MMKIYRFSHTPIKMLAFASAIALSGCYGASRSTSEVIDNTISGPTDPADPTDPTGGNGNIDDNVVPAILAADSADELIRQSLLGYYTTAANFGGNFGGSFGGSAGGLGEADEIQVDAPQAQPSPSADTAATSLAEASGGESRFSDTNIQEQGVDESDRIKIDGDVLFALEQPDYDYYGYGGPILSSIAIDVASDIAYPYEPQADTLSAYRLEGDNSSVVSRLPLQELIGRTTSGMYLHKNDSNTDLVLLSSAGYFSPWDSWGNSQAFGGLQSTVSWVDVSDPNSMSVRRTMDIQGHLISSRKIDNRLILVTRFYPEIPEIIPYLSSDADIEANRIIIANADASDFMPSFTITENGSTSMRPVIADNLCYSSKPIQEQSAGEGSAEDSAESSIYYPSPSIISILTIDLNNPSSEVSNACFVGDSETLYVSQQSVYLATTEYQYDFVTVSPEAISVDVETVDLISRPIQWSQPQVTTEIHKFSFNDSGAPVFKGSGSVEGHLGWNADRKPFRMSEKEGNLRVVTFDESRATSPVTLNILAESDGTLKALSTLPNDARPEPIGKPGESLYASRFIGDKAYLVTFRVTDPLYVLDVSNPNDPRIAGELEIPGYSDYLHPVNDSLLIGLGKDAIPDDGNGWGDGRGAFYQGVKLALYDVSDPANPFVADERVIGMRGTDSPALSQHHSFAYLQGNGDRNARLAFPLSFNNEPLYRQEPQSWSDWTSNNMLTMEVDESSNQFVDVPSWKFESRDAGFQYSPVGLENDRAIIGADGGLYVIHNGTLHFGQWGNSEPTASVQD